MSTIYLFGWTALIYEVWPTIITVCEHRIKAEMEETYVNDKRSMHMSNSNSNMYKQEKDWNNFSKEFIATKNLHYGIKVYSWR